jgi:hypothetical protein
LSWVLLWAGYTAPFRVLEVPAEAGAFACWLTLLWDEGCLQRHSLSSISGSVWRLSKAALASESKAEHGEMGGCNGSCPVELQLKPHPR